MPQRHETQDLDPVPTIDRERCTGCGLCVRVCAAGALTIKDGMVTVARPEACVYSGHCERICHRQAINRHFQIVFIPREK